MAERIGGPRKPGDEARLFSAYDAFVGACWPLAREEMDVSTSFGMTHVRRSGPDRGVPLVLIHPNSGSSVAWYRIVDRLAVGHPVYAIDTVGTAGRSVQTRPIGSEEDLAMWLDEVLDGLDLVSIHLVGFSEGGWIAGMFAAKTKAPARLRSLILLEPGGALHKIPRWTLAKLIVWGASIFAWPFGRERRVRALSAWLSPGVELTDAEVEFVLTVFSTYRQHLPAPKALTDEELRAVTTPALVLLGADTVICDPVAVADRARQLLPSVKVEIVDGAGHGLPFQMPELVGARVLRFIDGHEIRGSGAA
jgi:pimeloyl-ACP methyl ester carboxylesterase